MQIRLIVCSIRISHSCSYLTFDFLSGREAGYFCNIYGHDLWVLVMDLNKKICFKYPVNEIISDETEDEETVDAEEFWESVEYNIIARIFPNCVMQELKKKQVLTTGHHVLENIPDVLKLF